MSPQATFLMTALIPTPTSRGTNVAGSLFCTPAFCMVRRVVPREPDDCCVCVKEREGQREGGREEGKREGGRDGRREGWK